MRESGKGGLVGRSAEDYKIKSPVLTLKLMQLKEKLWRTPRSTTTKAFSCSVCFGSLSFFTTLEKHFSVLKIKDFKWFLLWPRNSRYLATLLDLKRSFNYIIEKFFVQEKNANIHMNDSSLPPLPKLMSHASGCR